MSDRRPVRVRPTEDGWKCPNLTCFKKPRNPVGSMNCTHCGCRFGTRHMIIGPPENSDSPGMSASPDKSDTTENADTSKNADTPENTDATGKDDDKGKGKEKAD